MSRVDMHRALLENLSKYDRFGGMHPREKFLKMGNLVHSGVYFVIIMTYNFFFEY